MYVKLYIKEFIDMCQSQFISVILIAILVSRYQTFNVQCSNYFEINCRTTFSVKYNIQNISKFLNDCKLIFIES